MWNIHGNPNTPKSRGTPSVPVGLPRLPIHWCGFPWFIPYVQARPVPILAAIGNFRDEPREALVCRGYNIPQEIPWLGDRWFSHREGREGMPRLVGEKSDRGKVVALGLVYRGVPWTTSSLTKKRPRVGENSRSEHSSSGVTRGTVCAPCPG